MSDHPHPAAASERRLPARRLTWAARMLLLPLVGCGGGVQRTLEVQHYKAECSGLFAKLCLQVRESDGQNFRNLFTEPAGFDYEWGFEYRIVIEEKSVSPVPLDGSSIRRRLVRVLSKDPVEPGTMFELVLSSDVETIVERSPGIFSIHGGREFACDAPVDCDGLRSALAPRTRIRYDFQHPPVPEEPLQLRGWRVEAESVP